MTPESEPLAADQELELPAEKIADVIPIRPEVSEPDVEQSSAEVIALKPEFENYTKSTVAGELSAAPQDARRAEMAAEARAKITALTNEQLVDAHDFYQGVAGRSKSPWKYQAEAQKHAAEIQRRGVSMDDIRPQQASAQPEQAASATTEEKTPKQTLFSFLRRG